MFAPATLELTSLHARELMRDRRYFWFALLFPFFMLGTFLAVGSLLPKDPGTPDFAQTVIPLALFLAVTSSALTVTSGPLAGMRSKGTLRLLGTSPVGRTRLVLTHLVTRLAFVVVQIVALIGIALALGTVEIASVPAVLGACLLGLAMFLGIGYIIGGRLNSPDAATNVGTLIQLSTLFLSGLAFPLWLMPDGVAKVLGALPTSFFADLLVAQTTSGRPLHAAWLSVVVVLTTAIVAIAVAIATFRWDQDETA